MRKLFVIFLLITFTQLSGFAQNWNWETINTNQQQDLVELEWLGGSSWACLAKNGWIGISTNNGNSWDTIPELPNTDFRSIERVLFPSQGIWKNMVITPDCRVFQLSSTVNQLIQDSLPYNLPNNNTLKKLINLNIANNGDLRYGLAGDSGLLRCYKNPWADPEFEFKFPTQKALNDVFPFNTWNLLVVGDSGNIWRTVGLANPFQKVNQNLTQARLNRVFGQGNNKLWIVGDSGTILQSGSGGQSWSKLPFPGFENLNAGIYADSGIWVCGTNGSVFFKSDSSNNWEDLSLSQNTEIKDIKSINNKIWICGKSGTLARLNLISSPLKLQKESNWYWECHEGELRIWQKGKEKARFIITRIEGKRIIENEGNFKEFSCQLPSKGLYIVQIEDKAGKITVLKVNNL
jgi:hypothetical protein